MIKGISTAGIGGFASLEDYIKKASQYGFGAVDTNNVGELRKFIGERGLEGALAFLQEHNVRIGSIGLPVEWRQDEARFRSDLTKLAADAEAAAQLGCTACCTYVLPSTDHDAVRFMAVATRRLRQVAQVLGVYGLRLGLEHVGPHHLRTAWKNPFIWDQDSFLDWFEAIGEKNVGFLYDAYHWYTSEANVEDIRRLKPEQIVHVHLNDAKPVPVADALDNDRLYPGEGVIDLAAFLRTLKEIGYKGVVAQEILTKEKPEGSQDDLLRRSADGFAKVYQAAGLE
ncbi:sugar phosphate isomerase/epimerase family protein [Paenibacillus aurantius]|uniref:Sugar phosphate isomerase/epimerase family protein n=1 Tax=Paenibacillus aurantius TaxID=2918900 RepID=A0AA96LGJ1_9BACL|nr:sugar phosphate isomerase/epimerase family protein [Paenibacillus aurantius]WNQ12618.1 sugar phosphate isomerase/epimerase family protein [Paenibacillus aurantius]